MRLYVVVEITKVETGDPLKGRHKEPQPSQGTEKETEEKSFETENDNTKLHFLEH